MVVVDCWYIVNWVWYLTILCFALLGLISKLLNKNYGIVILLRSTVPGNQHRHSTYQFLVTANVNTNTFIFTKCSTLFIYWVSVSQFVSGWHIILVGHLDFVQLTRFFFRFPRLGVSLFTTCERLFIKLTFLLIYYLVHLFLVRKIEVFSHFLYKWLRLSKIYKRRL